VVGTEQLHGQKERVKTLKGQRDTSLKAHQKREVNRQIVTMKMMEVSFHPVNMKMWKALTSHTWINGIKD
jgi:hypothetical protein